MFACWKVDVDNDEFRNCLQICNTFLTKINTNIHSERK